MIHMKKEKPLTENDILKYEIAEELGLLDKVKETGWKSLTAKESGRIGGIMTKRKKSKANEQDNG
ncbi:MAG: alpha/beta-type small acid-soluble spore protein [Defluviitaleaceae bacterium]|nr:alpha/beta-type small acid-soluble spore protein [Defluviitaleaceae bacterium]